MFHNNCELPQQATLLDRDWEKWNEDSYQEGLSISLHQSKELTQFSLALSMAIYPVHKIYGLSLDQNTVDFDLKKIKSFRLGQRYTALSRIKTYYKSFCSGI